MERSGNSMVLSWNMIRTGAASASLGLAVRLRGWLAGPDLAGRRLLTMEPPCCVGCRPGVAGAVLVDGATLPSGRTVELEGRLDREGPTWTLRSARRVDAGFGRRRLLATTPLLCLAAAVPVPDPAAVIAGAVMRYMHLAFLHQRQVQIRDQLPTIASPNARRGMPRSLRIRETADLVLAQKESSAWQRMVADLVAERAAERELEAYAA